MKLNTGVNVYGCSSVVDVLVGDDRLSKNFRKSISLLLLMLTTTWFKNCDREKESEKIRKKRDQQVKHQTTVILILIILMMMNMSKMSTVNKTMTFISSSLQKV